MWATSAPVNWADSGSFIKHVTPEISFKVGLIYQGFYDDVIFFREVMRLLTDAAQVISLEIFCVLSANM